MSMYSASQKGRVYMDNNNNMDRHVGSSGKNALRYKELQDETYGSSQRSRYEEAQLMRSSYSASYNDNLQYGEAGSYNLSSMGPGGRIHREFENGQYMSLGVGKNKIFDKQTVKTLPKYQTVMLKVEIHCEECIKKVKKTLAKMEGVDFVQVDAKQKKVTVTGHVDPQKVLKKALKTGKSVELLPYKDPVNKPVMSYDNRSTGGLSTSNTGGGVYSSAGLINNAFDRNRPTLIYPASRDDGSYDIFSDENANSCSIM